MAILLSASDDREFADSPWRQLATVCLPGGYRRSLQSGEAVKIAPSGRFVLWLITAGRVRATILEKPLEPTGDLSLMIPPGVTAHMACEGARPVDFVHIEFEMLLRGRVVRDARRYLRHENLTLCLPALPALSLYSRTMLLNPGQLLLRAPVNPQRSLGQLDASIQLLRVVYAMCQAATREDRAFPPLPQKSPMRRAYLFMLANRARADLKVTQIAEHVGLSVTHLTRMFRAEIGLSPMRAMARERMANAVRLLLSPDFRIGEIAAESGFASHQYFCRVFKAEHGMSPQEYRRQHLGDQ